MDIISDLDIMKAIQYCNYAKYVKYKCDIDGLNNDVDYLSFCSLLNRVDYFDIKRCSKLLHNRYVRKSRIYRNIDFMLNNYSVCYFCTFTLNNDSVNLSLKYLKHELTDCLKLLRTPYVGNVDFGDKNGRLHFHVIIAENDIHICKQNIYWRFGNFDIKVINLNDGVAERLGSYIMKLVNHATKETTKDRIITPRGEFSFNNLMLKMS